MSYSTYIFHVPILENIQLKVNRCEGVLKSKNKLERMVDKKIFH